MKWNIKLKGGVGTGMFMIAELCRRSGVCRNTIYNLLKRGVIKPEDKIGRINIYSDETVKAIRKHYAIRKYYARAVKALEAQIKNN